MIKSLLSSSVIFCAGVFVGSVNAIPIYVTSIESQENSSIANVGSAYVMEQSNSMVQEVSAIPFSEINDVEKEITAGEIFIKGDELKSGFKKLGQILNNNPDLVVAFDPSSGGFIDENGKFTLDYKHIPGNVKYLKFVNVDGVKELDEYFLAYNKSIKSIDLSGMRNLKSIGNSFMYESVIGSFTLSDLPVLESFGDNFMNNCPLLLSVNISNLPKLKSAGYAPFAKCEEKLASVTISNLPALEFIESYAFAECFSLSSVEVKGLASLKAMGDHLFAKCTSLESFFLSNLPALESLGNWAFSGCTSLKSFSFSDLPSLKSIGNWAFSGCVLLESLEFSKEIKLKSLGLWFCVGCKKLDGDIISAIKDEVVAQGQESENGAFTDLL